MGWRQSSFSVAYNYIDQSKRETPLLTQSKLEYLRHKFVAQLQLHLVSRLNWGVKYRLQKRTGSYTTTEGGVEPYHTYDVVDTRLAWNANQYSVYAELKPYHTYDVVDTRLAWNANQYSVYAELNNLFGSHSIDYGNVPQPGTWFIAGLTLTY